MDDSLDGLNSINRYTFLLEESSTQLLKKLKYFSAGIFKLKTDC